MKTRDRRIKCDARGAKQDIRAAKQEVRGTKPDNRTVKPEHRGRKPDSREDKRPASQESTAAADRRLAKRSGLDAVKLHLQATGGTGRTSRSATSVKHPFLFKIRVI